jgi:small subunit ribosomal protein S20
MAHSRTAKKRVRQNASARALNRWRLRDMREAFKNFNEQVSHGTLEQATEAFKKAIKIVDRTAQKGVIHKNQASRRKSRMSARLKAKKTAKA